MIPYIKIDTPFERDNDGTKKLIDGKFRNETVEYLKDNKWLLLRKIDAQTLVLFGMDIKFRFRDVQKEHRFLLNW